MHTIHSGHSGHKIGTDSTDSTDSTASTDSTDSTDRNRRPLPGYCTQTIVVLGALNVFAVVLHVPALAGDGQAFVVFRAALGVQPQRKGGGQALVHQQRRNQQPRAAFSRFAMDGDDVVGVLLQIRFHLVAKFIHHMQGTRVVVFEGVPLDVAAVFFAKGVAGIVPFVA